MFIRFDMIHERDTEERTDRQTDRQRTETATIRVLSDLLDAVDRGDTAALVLLDFTAAFDTVDHEILLERLRDTFGDNSGLAWFQSYLAGRTQHVRCGGKCSTLFSGTIQCKTYYGESSP